MVDCPLKKWDFSNDIDENNPMPEEQKPEDYYKDMIIVP